MPFTEKPALIEGAVGLVSTPVDFLRFSQMLLNNGELDGVRLLQAETVKAMTVNGLSDPILKARGGNIGWGLGNVDVVVGAGSRGYLTSIGEYGWDGSIGTFFAVDPSKELVVTLMTQNVPANPDGCVRSSRPRSYNQSLNKTLPIARVDAGRLRGHRRRSAAQPPVRLDRRASRRASKHSRRSDALQSAASRARYRS